MSQVSDLQLATTGVINGLQYTNDLNDILAAIGSHNKGTTAPSNPVTGMLWIDDSANPIWKLKLYDGTDWLTLQTIDSTGNTASASGYSNENIIINGDFNSWQEGTSFAAISNNTYFADVWQYNETSTAIHTVSRDTDVPPVAESGHFSNYSIKVDCTTADTSIAAADLVWVETSIEGYNFLPIAQQNFTISFWHKHSKPGTYCVAFLNSGHDRSYVSEYTQSVSEVWEKSTITVTASPSGGTWNYGDGLGLEIRFVLACGSTYQTNAGSWQTGSYLSATSNQVNACDSTLNDFKIAQVKLEPGPVATPFTGRNHQNEIDKIYRYFWRFDNNDIWAGIIGTGQANSATVARVPISYKVPMRIAPSVSVSHVTDFFLLNSTGLSVNTTAVTADSISRFMAVLSVTASGLAAGNATEMLFDNNPNRYIDFDARL